MRLTQKRLKEVLTYHPESGHFTSNHAIRGRAKGSVCGCNDKMGRHGYIAIRIDGTLYRAQRLAFLYMTGEWPHDQVDHIDGITNNNRWSNLRQIDAQGNSRNSKLYSNNKSGHTGIRFNESMRKWTAEICVDGRNRYIGAFADKAKAIAARKQANEKHGFWPDHGQRRA